MHNRFHVLGLVAVCVSVACGQQLTAVESKLIGDWSIPRRTELTDNGFAGATHGFDVTSFKADHTFSQTTHSPDLPVIQVLSGVWHAEGEQLLLKFTWAHPSMQDMVTDSVCRFSRVARFMRCRALCHRQNFHRSRAGILLCHTHDLATSDI